MRVICGDCLTWLKAQPDDSVDLVLTSPPYVDARTYGIGYKLKGDAWVAWCLDRYMECLRVSRGMVCWVVEGKTRNYQYDATPLLLASELHKRGEILRKPPIFKRVGIPGSGGPDWFRNDYELVICASSRRGKLAWSDNTAMGKPPKYDVGGAMSNRQADGRRLNHGEYQAAPRRLRNAGDGRYSLPKLANPGNVIECIVGGGVMGSKLAHENEAPFPEALATFFVRSLCPPGGVVLDPFCGSGTTLAVALMHGRDGIGVDVRASQCDLTRRRIAEAKERVGGRSQQLVKPKERKTG